MNDFPKLYVPSIIEQYCEKIIDIPKKVRVPFNYKPIYLFLDTLLCVILIINAIAHNDLGLGILSCILVLTLYFFFIYPVNTKYDLKLKEYHNYIIELEKYRIRNKSKESKENHCWDKLKEIYQKSPMPIKVPYAATHYRSKIKIEFGEKLIERFNNAIDINCSISDFSFIPAFIFYDKPSGLKFAIEITDPEILKKNQRYKFYNENDFFINNNCPIIHFTEDQVSYYPIESIEVICNVIAYFALSLDKKFITSPLNDKAKITYESNSDFFNKLREKYL